MNIGARCQECCYGRMLHNCKYITVDEKGILAMLGPIGGLVQDLESDLVRTCAISRLDVYLARGLGDSQIRLTGNWFSLFYSFMIKEVNVFTDVRGWKCWFQ